VTRHLFACGTDNDGAPECMGDGSTCGPDGRCVALIHWNMPRVYDAWRRDEPEALALVALVNKGPAMTNDEKLQARVLLRGYGVEPDEMKNPNEETS
jgi:predicted DNA-binding helix-hairpin-helix protein